MADGPQFRRAMYLVTATSLLVPVVGVLTAPILAQALGVAGRGEVATAMAPNSLVVSVATLGLPDALTFQLARRPSVTRRALALSGLVSVFLGALCFGIAVVSAAVLADGDSALADLVLLGTALAVPTLLINLLRGAAMGRQLWVAVAAERTVNSVLRLIVLGGLAVLGDLTVIAAVLVVSVAPLVAGVAYWRLFYRPDGPDPPAPIAGPLLAYGARSWLGSVAGMLNGRVSQLVITPLSDVRELGLFVVAITISDVPLIATTAVGNVIFGVNSRTADAEQVTATSRLVTLVGSVGAAVIGAALPMCLAPLFGAGFEGALVPSLLLLVAGVLGLPGLIAAAGLGAWERPGLRSTVVVVGLSVNTTALLVLVPPHGATGAAVAGILSATTSSLVGVAAAARVTGSGAAAFVVPRRSDLARIRSEVGVVARRVRRRHGGVVGASSGPHHRRRPVPSFRSED